MDGYDWSVGDERKRNYWIHLTINNTRQYIIWKNRRKYLWKYESLFTDFSSPKIFIITLRTIIKYLPNRFLLALYWISNIKNTFFRFQIRYLYSRYLRITNSRIRQYNNHFKNYKKFELLMISCIIVFPTYLPLAYDIIIIYAISSCGIVILVLIWTSW